MDILDKIVEFLDENFEELRKVATHSEYLGLIDKWTIKPEDQSKFKNKKVEMTGSEYGLKDILRVMDRSLKNFILEFKNDKRSREEKYNDSLEQALTLEKIWNI